MAQDKWVLAYKIFRDGIIKRYDKFTSINYAGVNMGIVQLPFYIGYDMVSMLRKPYTERLAYLDIDTPKEWKLEKLDLGYVVRKLVGPLGPISSQYVEMVRDKIKFDASAANMVIRQLASLLYLQGKEGSNFRPTLGAYLVNSTTTTATDVQWPVCYPSVAVAPLITMRLYGATSPSVIKYIADPPYLATIPNWRFEVNSAQHLAFSSDSFLYALFTRNLSIQYDMKLCPDKMTYATTQVSDMSKPDDDDVSASFGMGTDFY
jgi:hypothetical protein